MLWSRSIPLEGSLAERYLRSRDCYVASSSIRFLPATGSYPPTMIAKFGLSKHTQAVHLTRLKADGTGKAGTDKDKIILGPTEGKPIVVQRGTRSSLVMTEGIEDAASLALCRGWTTWSAGSSSMVPKTVTFASSFSHVFFAVDPDKAGEEALIRALKIRPDLVAIRLSELTGTASLDANKALMTLGVKALSQVIDKYIASI
jgi:hypothetical protein